MEGCACFTFARFSGVVSPLRLAFRTPPPARQPFTHCQTRAYNPHPKHREGTGVGAVDLVMDFVGPDAAIAGCPRRWKLFRRGCRLPVSPILLVGGLGFNGTSLWCGRELEVPAPHR